jgi:alpha-galactosidase
MKRACLSQSTNTYEQNHASSIRPLKINFVKMKNILLSCFILLVSGCSYAQKKEVKFIDEMDLYSMTSGWGESQSLKSVQGGKITIAGHRYKRGVGTHANSEFTINLKGNGLRFKAFVGIDDEAAPFSKDGGTVEFSLILDGTKVYSSGVVRYGEKPREIIVNIEGGKQMELRVDGTIDGSNGDHADWAMARIEYKSNAKLMPEELYHKVNVEKYILTPDASDAPKLNGADIFGARSGHPFLYRIPASGANPKVFVAEGLPKGLLLDKAEGIISGVVTDPGTYKVNIEVTNAKGLDKRSMDFVIGDKIALTPPMGWNSWNCFGLEVNEERVKAAADAMIHKGLVNYGWSYINIDDGWEAPARDAEGNIQANAKFGNIARLAEYLHSKGLKLGIYSSPGIYTCGNFLGTYQHEEQDAKTYATWGIDYLKYDWCSYGNIAKDRSLPELQKPYINMAIALAKTNRDIVYSLCQYGMGNVSAWGGSIGGNCWRTTGDIVDTWGSVKTLLQSQVGLDKYTAPGNWNDPDMLVLGMVGWSGKLHETRLNPREQYLHFTMWCMLSAPLLLGCDLTQLDSFTLKLLTNAEVIAVNQDRLGKQASMVKQINDCQVWIKPLSDGSLAVAMVNLGYSDQKISLSLSDIGITVNKNIRDLWKQAMVAEKANVLSVNLPSHGSILYKLF